MTGLRVGYVLGTTSGGTGRHVAMLAAGCLSEGLSVAAFGPEATRSLFAAGVGTDRGRSAGAGAGTGIGGSVGSAGTSPPAVVAFEPVEISDRPRPVADVMTVRRLRRLLMLADLDVLHAHGLRAAALAALALRPASLIRWPRGPAPALVVTVHNAPPAAARAAAVYRLLERLVAHRADVVLCVSADLAARMRRLGVREVGLAIVPAAEPARSWPAGLGQAGRQVVLAAGRLTSQKGFDTLLAAAALWRARRPEPQLVIAGDGPLATELAALARDLGVAARFLGPRDDVPELLAAADVFVLPSRWEGQPLILQEALHAGRPIVATDTGGIPDLTGTEAALLVPPDDPARLAAAVLRVLDDHDLAARLGIAARARAAALPTRADAVAAALAWYGRLATRSQPTTG